MNSRNIFQFRPNDQRSTINEQRTRNNEQGTRNKEQRYIKNNIKRNGEKDSSNHSLQYLYLYYQQVWLTSLILGLEELDIASAVAKNVTFPQFVPTATTCPNYKSKHIHTIPFHANNNTK